jgi:ankyrin repeat domain-containing protein 17
LHHKYNFPNSQILFSQARLEALLEAAGISRLTGESKQLADPDVLKRLTSSVR